MVVKHAEERLRHVRFVIEDAGLAYRVPLSLLYGFWSSYNDRLYDGVMVPPHFAIGHTPPTLAASCSPSTDYGASMQTAFKRSLLINPDPEYVATPWGLGHGQYLDRLVLRYTALQKLVEVDRTVSEEQLKGGYHAYGPALAAEINRVGPQLKLPQRVVYKRRRPEDQTVPLASGWPHNVLGVEYFLGHVTTAALALAGFDVPGLPRRHADPGPPVWEMIRRLAASGRTGTLERIAARHVRWLAESGAATGSLPLVAAFERGREDADGSPIKGEVAFDPGWLGWEGGEVLRLAEGIMHHGSYSDLPVLSDALEEAGCSDGHILGHLRAPNRAHGPSCWVLAGIIAAAHAASVHA